MIEYERAGRVWKFGPLPVSVNTAKIFTAMAVLKDADKDRIDGRAVADLIAALPGAMARSMRDWHTEDEVNQFIDTCELDFGNPESLGILLDLSLLFMGLNPKTAPKANALPAAG